MNPSAFPLPPLKLAVAAAAATALGLAGCVNYAGIHSDQHIAAPTDFATRRSLPAEGGHWPDAGWANQFSDPQLSQLIDEAIAGNPTLAQAQARVIKAAAWHAGAHAHTLPKIDAQYSLTRGRSSANALFPPPLGGSWFTEHNALLSAWYELDLWGKHRAMLAAALSMQKAADAQFQQAKLTLATTVADTYNEFARLAALADLARGEIAYRRQISRTIAARLQAGLATQLERHAAGTELATSQTTFDQLNGQLTLVRYQLSALLGKGPDRGLAIAPPVLGSASAEDEIALPDELPADLVARRPDLAAARWQVDASVHDIEQTQAEFYPNLNLAAMIGLDAFGFGRFLTASSRQLQIAPAIHLPIFDAGALRAQLTSRYADFNAAVANYNQTLINALNEVATQVASIHSTHQQIADAQDAYEADQQSCQLTVASYRAGLAPQLAVLDAQLNVLAHKQLLVNLQAARRAQQIGLIKALGGGFGADYGKTACAHPQNFNQKH